LLDNSSIGKPLGSFYLYDYAGFDPENGKMLYYTAAGTAVTQDALDANKDKKIFRFYLAFTYGITLGVNYKNFDFSVDGYGTLEQKCTMVRKHNVFQEKI
jgi:hypothetical protein